MFKNWISNQIFCWEIAYEAIVFRTKWHLVRFKSYIFPIQIGSESLMGSTYNESVIMWNKYFYSIANYVWKQYMLESDN